MVSWIPIFTPMQPPILIYRYSPIIFTKPQYKVHKENIYILFLLLPCIHTHICAYVIYIASICVYIYYFHVCIHVYSDVCTCMHTCTYMYMNKAYVYMCMHVYNSAVGLLPLLKCTSI